MPGGYIEAPCLASPWRSEERPQRDEPIEGAHDHTHPGWRDLTISAWSLRAKDGRPGRGTPRLSPPAGGSKSAGRCGCTSTRRSTATSPEPRPAEGSSFTTRARGDLSRIAISSSGSRRPGPTA
ncbi:DUF6349 family protein [Streptomyces sp. NPDC012508]|uniref:DUF6349 family protein n=1 Tax=Streptomyces sp. NPDC012508 TaxID=3364837 RepID=UPI00367CB32B